MALRSKARETAVQMLYQLDLNPDVPLGTVREMIAEQISQPDSREFSWELFIGTMEIRPALDLRIEAIAENWKLSRMAPTDRNILRLGAFELLHTHTPPHVVVDEAIEMAKRFGTAQSPQFVNGILDKLIVRERPADAPEESADPPVDTTDDNNS